MITIQFILISVDLWGAFFCLVAVSSILIGKTADKKGSRWLIALITCLMLLLISNLINRLNMENGVGRNVAVFRAAVWFTFFFGFLEMPLAAEFLTCLIERRSGIEGILWKYIEWIFFAIGVSIITINLRSGFLYSINEEGVFLPQPLIVLPDAVSMIGVIISVGVVMRFIKYLVKFEKAAFIAFLILPFAAIGFNMVRGDSSFVMPAFTVSVLMLYFSYEFSSREYRIELERNLADRQITMFCRQIQPHFIFNSLALIKYQCRTAPETAIDTIDEFSDYLRDSTDLMSSTQCVSAERELDLVRHYISLQKLRFEEIDYRVRIDDTDFMIPPFAIQTLVENSITHGLRGQTGADPYVSVKTFKNRAQHVIEIEDNGSGFNVKELENKTDSGHVGLLNTEERIRLMCGGSMKVSSEIGKGTKVTVTIPEHRRDHP